MIVIKHRKKKLLDRVRDAIRTTGHSVRTEQATSIGSGDSSSSTMG
jgi:hypothetical protein